MKKIICEMCGSSDLLKKDGVYECQSCGTKYSVEEAKKMMVEGTVKVEGIVQIDSSNKINNLLKNGKNLYKDGKYKEAYDLFGDALNIDTENYTAIAYRGLCSAWDSSVQKPLIDDAASGLSKGFKIARSNLGETEEYANFVMETSSYFFQVYKACVNHYIKYLNDSSDSFHSRINYCLNSDVMAALKLQKDLESTIKLGSQRISLTVFALMSVCTEIFSIEDVSVYSPEQYLTLKKNIDACLDCVKGYVEGQAVEAYKMTYLFSKLCEDKAKESRRLQCESYFKEHPEEKAELEDVISSSKKEITKLLKNIDESRASISSIEKKMSKELKPLTDKLNKVDKDLDELYDAKSQLGIFDRKLKKEVQAQLDAKREEYDSLKEQLETAKEEKRSKNEKELKKCYKKIAESKDKIDNLLEKITSASIERYGEVEDLSDYKYTDEAGTEE